jgi:hypothetical protein
MFRSLILGAVALAVIAVPPATAWSASLLRFQLANEAGYALTEIHVSPSLEDGWGGDLLGPAPLPSGGAREIAVNGRAGTCHYDIRFVGDDGSLIEAVAVDLCTTERYTLEP